MKEKILDPLLDLASAYTLTKYLWKGNEALQNIEEWEPGRLLWERRASQNQLASSEQSALGGMAVMATGQFSV